MGLSAAILLITMVCFTGSAGLLWWIAKKDGQFEDIEGIKYRMLQDE